MAAHLPLILISVSLISVASGYHRRVETNTSCSNCHHWTLEAGDLVACNINFYARHMMLVTGNNSVIHLLADKDNNKALIRAEPWPQAKNGFGKCSIVTEKMDSRMMQQFGVSPFPVEYAIARARSLEGQTIYYDFVRCNCEHWINYWKYGIAFCFQDPSTGLTNSECAI